MAATTGSFETAFQDIIGFAVVLWRPSLLGNCLHRRNMVLLERRSDDEIRQPIAAQAQ
jgi:hypothetical protein